MLSRNGADKVARQHGLSVLRMADGRSWWWDGFELTPAILDATELYRWLGY